MSDFQDLLRVLKNQNPVITLNSNGIITAGAKGNDGGLQLYDNNGFLRASMHGPGALVLREPPAGGLLGQVAVQLSAEGSLHIAAGGKDRFRLGSNGNCWIGGNGEDGDIFIFDKSGDNHSPDQATIRLAGESGDIILKNADCAEDFEVTDPAGVEPGHVMVIDDDGRVRASTEAYDRKVAGVIAGAGTYRPGIILGRRSSTPGAALAVLGRTFCKVDCNSGPIALGDLLTTSFTKGHAMKAVDSGRAFGSVLGKALARHTSGTGLIPILVALQ